MSEKILTIESVAPNPNLMMWKFDGAGRIESGAKLIVRESQSAIALYKGEIVGVFGAGIHAIAGEDAPLLSKLLGAGDLDQYNIDVYFFAAQDFINNKWGTPAPILIKDKEFGNARIRAFGSYDVRIGDPALFFKRYAGTFPQLTISELQNQMLSFIAPKFGEILSEENISLMEIAKSASALGEKIKPRLSEYFGAIGLKLLKFIVISVTPPDEVLKHIDKLTNMNMTTDMQKYAAFQAANAKDRAAQVAIENMPNPNDISTKLLKLKSLFETGLIDAEEYKAKKAELLADFGG